MQEEGVRAMSELYVTVLGKFSIRSGDQFIDDSSNRMRKIWLLLAYLIFCRTTRITQESLLQALSSDDGDSDPSNRVKAMLYRARTMLDQLGVGVGHNLIQFKNGCYSWNTQLPITVDVEEFERLCSAAAQQTDQDTRLELYQKALSLYGGDVLPKLSSEAWIMPINTYYHQMYLEAVQHTLEALEQRNQWEPAVALCRRALEIEPYSEHLYQHLMRALIALDDRVGALHAYEEMSELLFSNFGVMPSDESRQLYRDASREVNHTAVTMELLRDILREPEVAKGALLCEYDFFRLIYQVQARTIVRSGDVVHIALLSIHSRNKKELSRRSLDTAMDNLQDVLVHGLRQGDIVTKCSVSQFVIMLPHANYENSCAVCERVRRAFWRKHPHSPAHITFSVHHLEPNIHPE